MLVGNWSHCGEIKQDHKATVNAVHKYTLT